MKTKKHMFLVARWIYKKFKWGLVAPYFIMGALLGVVFIISIKYFNVNITLISILVKIFTSLFIARVLHFLSFYPAGLFFPTIIGDKYRLSWKKKLFIYSCTVIIMILFFHKVTESL